VLIYEFNCCAFYSVHENELYVVVVKLLVAFTFLTSMDNCMSLIVMLFIIRGLNVLLIDFSSTW
jgi:hypothetical protein